jgi:O-antigen/teichoic acid export membrane protein
MPETTAACSETEAAAAAPLTRRARGRIAGWLQSAHAARQRLLNIAFLVVGLALGQGSIFIVQTALVSTGEYNLLSAFGTHYSFAILGVILVDAGASTTLARAVARLDTGPDGREQFWRIFCETSVIRLLFAVFVGAAAVICAFGMAADGFTECYVALALPGLLVWAFNAVGLLDGLRLSGVSGVTGAAAYIAAAIGLCLAAHRSAETAGAILGAVFSIGYLLTVAAQWIALRRRGWLPQFRTPTEAGLIRALKDGCAMLFQLVPGQINMRVQLVLSATHLGAETTALFVYAKQVVTALTQIIAFVLRVEFPGLVEKLSAAGSHGPRSVLDAQKMTFYCTIVFAFGATAVAGVAAALPGFSLHRAATMILSFAPTILTLSLSLMMIQALAALGAYRAIAAALMASALAGVLVSYLLIALIGVYAFVAGEFAFHLVGIYAVVRYLRQTHRAVATSARTDRALLAVGEEV